MTTPVGLPYAPPSTESLAPRPGRRALLFVLAGIGLCGVLGVGTCAATLAGTVISGETSLDPICQRYLHALSAGDDHAIYADVDPAMKAVVSEGELTRVHTGFRAYQGELRSAKITGVHEGVDSEGRWGRLVYACDLEKGPATVTFDLRKRDAGWKIVAFHWSSPELEKAVQARAVEGPNGGAH
jgi:hypothetical protein